MKKVVIFVMFCIEIVFAEPTLNLTSVSSERDTNIIQNNYASSLKKEVRVTVDRDYRGDNNTIKFRSLASQDVVIKCNKNEYYIKPSSTQTVMIKTDIDGYSPHYRKSGDKEIYIPFETFRCKCLNCTFMKE